MRYIATLLLPVLIFANPSVPDRIPSNIDPYRGELMDAYSPEGRAEMPRGEVIGLQQDYSIHREGGPWTEIGGIPGASVQELVFAPSSLNVAYASTYGDGVYRSENGGYTWVQTSMANLLCSRNGLDVDPLNPDIVYVGAYDAGHFEFGTFRSQDGGNSWESWGPDSLTYAYTIEVNPVHPDTVYLGGSEGFFYTWDGGETWFQNYDAGSYISHIRSHPTDPNVVYTASYGQFLVSADAGVTFEEIYLPDYYSIYHIDMDPNSPETIYLSTNGGLLITHDGGSSWGAVDEQFGWDPSDPSSPPPYIQGTAVDLNDSDHILTHSGYYGVFESYDGGETWNHEHPPVPDVSGYGVTYSPSDGQFVASLWWKGLWRFNGSDWSRSDTGLDHQYVDEVAIVNENEIWAATLGYGVFKTDDGGWTWEQKLAPSHTWNCYSVAVHPEDPSIALAGFRYGGMYLSTDGGDTWTNAVGGDSMSVRDIQYCPSNSDVVYAHGYNFFNTINEFYRSNDGGLTWITTYSSTDQRLYNYGVDPDDDNHLIMCKRFDPFGEGSGYYSVESFDGGYTWEDYDALLLDYRGYDFTLVPETSIVLASTWGNGVLKMTDYGWEPAGEGIPEGAAAGDMEFTPLGDILVDIWGAGIYASLDSGATWEPDNEGLTSSGSLSKDSEVTGLGVMTIAGTYGGNFLRTTSSAPMITTIPSDTLDFGDVYIGYPDTSTVIIRNSGLSPLEVYSAELTGDGFSLVNPPADTITLDFWETFDLDIAFDPALDGNYLGEITILSNSVENDTLVIEVIATALFPPEISVSPDSLWADLFTGETETQTLTIANTGESDLVYQLEVESVEGLRNTSSLAGNPPLNRQPVNIRELLGISSSVRSLRSHRADVAGRERISSRSAGSRDWSLLYTDPDDDTLTYDVGNVYGMSNGIDIAVKFESYEGWGDPYEIGMGVIVIVDADQNTETGYYVGEWDVGADFVVNGSEFFEMDMGLYVVIDDGDIEWLSPLTIFELEANSNFITVGVSAADMGDPEAIDFYAWVGALYVEDLDYVPDIYSGHISWELGPGWLELSSEGGTIPAGGQDEITVIFDASSLFGGDYFADIIVSSNDPTSPEVTVPAHLDVTGASDIAMSSDTLDFGEVFINYSDTLELIVENEGTDDLVISDVQSGNPELTVTPASLTIPPMSSDTLSLVLLSYTEGEFNTTVTLTTNDPDESTVEVPVVSTILIAPDIVVSPQTFDLLVPSGETISDTLILANEGGSNLDYQIAVIYDDGSRDEGGPDAFGYSWKDSNEPNGPEFAWVDASDGTSIYLYDDDYVTGIPLGFDFSYYGTEYNAINIMSNGWLSFTDYDSWTPNQIPHYNSYEYQGAIGPFTGDLYPPEGEVRYKIFGSTPERVYVVEFNNVPWCCSGPPYMTFEVLFYESGDKIRFQYLDLDGNLPWAIGISSPDNSTGLGNGGEGITYISTYIVEDNYAIEFSSQNEWLNIEPSSGIVVAGDELEINLTADAMDLEVGEYTAEIIITSNDPDDETVTIPVMLTVTGVGIDNQVPLPEKYALHQNYPNPFNPVTTIRYDLPEVADVRLTVYDLLGREVLRLVNERQEAGYQSVIWNGRDRLGREVATGIYIYRLTAGDFVMTRKLVLMK